MKYSAYISAAVVLLGSGCGRGNDAPAPAKAEVAAQYRDSVLLVSDVVSQLPPGISAEDSVRLSEAIVDQWIDGHLIEETAATQIDDYDRIERLTAQYRRSLIVESYRRKSREQGIKPVDNEAVADYYRQHKAEMKLERPIVKGLFIRMSSESPRLSDARKWMGAPGPEAYDGLENIPMKENASFRYFMDRWVDFDALSGEIPYRFGDADRFVESNGYFETEHNGIVYLLHISDYRKSGDVMPEDYAAPLIEDRIRSINLKDYEAALIKALRKNAIEKEILKVGKQNI